MSRSRFFLLVVVFAFVVSGWAAPSTRAQSKDITVGVILPLTGAAAAIGPEIKMGVTFAFQQVNNQVAGHNVVIKFEDETDDPTQAVARARKLVEEDKADVIIGPQLAHTGAAVSAYAAQADVVNIALGASDKPTSDSAFYPGSGRGDAYVTGLFAATDLKAKTAAILYADYLFGQQSRDGFMKGFTEQGGTVSINKAVPFGTADMSPYLEGLDKVDVVALLLLNPSDFAFVRQYRQAGLKKPVIFISNAPQESPLLAQMGDDVIGMYGASWYSPLIDSDTNKTFVADFTKQYNRPPGMAVHIAYSAAQMYIEAVKAANGDTSPKAITDALIGLKQISNPAGVITMGAARVATHDHYIFQVAKLDLSKMGAPGTAPAAGTAPAMSGTAAAGAPSAIYVWTVVKKYDNIKPQ